MGLGLSNFSIMVILLGILLKHSHPGCNTDNYAVELHIAYDAFDKQHVPSSSGSRIRYDSRNKEAYQEWLAAEIAEQYMPHSATMWCKYIQLRTHYMPNVCST